MKRKAGKDPSKERTRKIEREKKRFLRLYHEAVDKIVLPEPSETLAEFQGSVIFPPDHD